MIDCKSCKARHRADKIIEDAALGKGDEIIVDGMTFDQMKETMIKYDVVCPDCGKADFTDIRQFNLMFKTFQGVTESSTNEIYLRPETAQGIFVNFKTFNVLCANVHHLVSHKSVNLSVTKLHRVTSHSVHVNSNKWSLNSSVNLAKTLNGMHIGKNSVKLVTKPRHERRFDAPS